MAHAYRGAGASCPHRQLAARMGTGAAVSALHVGIGLAILATFTGGVIRFVPRNVLPAEQWFAPPARPLPTAAPDLRASASAKPVAQTSEQRTLAPLAPIDLTPGDSFVLPPVGPVGGSGSGIVPLDPPSSSASPAFAPQRARAIGNPSLWITQNDYPARAIREGWSGVTRFRLAIAPSGAVDNCTVTASSGHEELDRVACARIAARARFSAARDETGQAASGTYDGAIRWQIVE